ncbi:MAG: O-antigen ligase family protein [Flavobacteriales bacterium]|nr:O-antigen ligase family protein [Flavobacteriales bacterium]
MRILDLRTAGPHRAVHLGALALALVMLPWSEFLLSLSLIILLVNWLWEGIAKRDLGGRFKRAFTTPESAVFISFFGLHLLGLLWTTDLKWGMDLCRILLPVLVFGLVLSTAPRFNAQQLRDLLLLGAWSATASTIACLAMRHGAMATGEYRELSPFISHIRLSLMLCFAIAVFIVYWPERWAIRMAHVAAITLCLFFLDQLSSLIALPVLAVLVVFLMWRKARHKGVRLQWAAAGLVLAVLVTSIWYLRSCVKDYWHADPTDLQHLDVASAGGEVYYHDLRDPQRENGHYVWVNVADKELERGWHRKSNLPLGGKDELGQPLHGTLVRYLASLGVRKGSTGLAALKPEDVKRIESGMTSVVEGRQGAMRARIEQVLYELETYRTSGDPSGHSVTMRIEFQRTGWAIAKQHWLTGVGTGDTQLAFNAAYASANSPLAEKWRLRAHNEYLTLCISFGVFGLLWSLFSWGWPAWRMRAFRQPLFIAWGIIFLLSCFSEDTIETQMGATFFALYYALFVFAAPPIPEATPAHAPPGSA